MTDTRTCRECGETQPIEEFPRSGRRGEHYRSHRCRLCRNQYYQNIRDSKRNAAVTRLLRWAPPRVRV